jgi:hypothetical protein
MPTEAEIFCFIGEYNCTEFANFLIEHFDWFRGNSRCYSDLSTI